MLTFLIGALCNRGNSILPPISLSVRGEAMISGVDTSIPSGKSSSCEMVKWDWA